MPLRLRSTERPVDAAPLRFMLHSHDSFGLGHLRRTMTIAGALREHFPASQVLISTGSPCATHFGHEQGIDVVKLPSVTKNGSGAYVPRSLGDDLEPLLELRKRMLAEIHRTFAPHVLIVDHQVLGLRDELDEVLRDARRIGTRTVLGVRDIIDAPEVVAREWGRPRARHALAHEYDRVCVYGAPEVFDPRLEYSIPHELRSRLEFTGYVARDAVPERAAPPSGAPKNVLVTVGGGEDGAERIETYLEALGLEPAHWTSTIVAGPLLEARVARGLKKRAKAIEGVELSTFHADVPHLLSRADAVVSMAGYNSVVEILQSGVPAVLCPRSFPRREQLMRAQHMERLGLAQCVASGAPIAMRSAVERALTQPVDRTGRPPLDGTARLCAVLDRLLRETRPAFVAESGR